MSRIVTRRKNSVQGICRVLTPEKVIDKAVVIREDGTVWDIWLSNFESWELIEIEREGGNGSGKSGNDAGG